LSSLKILATLKAIKIAAADNKNWSNKKQLSPTYVHMGDPYSTVYTTTTSAPYFPADQPEPSSQVKIIIIVLY